MITVDRLLNVYKWYGKFLETCLVYSLYCKAEKMVSVAIRDHI